MLVIDSVSSHIYENFIWLYYSKNILLFWLLLHIIHLLQLLDIVYFQPLKYYHAEAMDNVVQIENIEFTHIVFLAYIQLIWK